MNFVIPKIVDHFRRRAASIELGNLNVARDFSDVRDVSSVYVNLLERRLADKILNICSGVSTPLADVLQLCAEFTGHSMNVKINSNFKLSNEVERLQGDPRYLLMTMEHIPMYCLEETLRWMLEE